MIIEQIVTLANKTVELQFHAMERSLRATGCMLPITVIPFNAERFTLPTGSSWLEDPEWEQFIDSSGRCPVMRKYIALSMKNYQFIDVDVCFLRNPEIALRSSTGFTVCCGHWRNPDHTTTSESRIRFEQASTNWTLRVFNSGQFACDSVLYSREELPDLLLSSRFRPVCLDSPFHEQPGMNLLVLERGISVTNLTLPPASLESSWAGDYRDANFSRYWEDESRKPFLLHWAGRVLKQNLPVNELYFQFLSAEERRELQASLKGGSHNSKFSLFRRWTTSTVRE